MKESESVALATRVPWINFVTGILVLISPWALHANTLAAQWDMTVTGIIIAIIALIAQSVHGKNYWPIANVLLGVWLLISISFVGPTMTWSNIVLGIMTIVTGLVAQGYESSSSRRTLRA